MVNKFFMKPTQKGLFIHAKNKKKVSIDSHVGLTPGLSYE